MGEGEAKSEKRKARSEKRGFESLQSREDAAPNPAESAGEETGRTHSSRGGRSPAEPNPNETRVANPAGSTRALIRAASGLLRATTPHSAGLGGPHAEIAEMRRAGRAAGVARNSARRALMVTLPAPRSVRPRQLRAQPFPSPHHAVCRTRGTLQI